ncbi:hypothetical protein ACEV9E_23885, partial [Vibrio parahaemolyticus]
LAGGGPSQPTQEEIRLRDERKFKEASEENFPPGEKNVASLGRDWYTFELEVGGKTRKFLYRVHNPRYNSATETITELKD